MKKFEVIFLTEARKFLLELDEKAGIKSSSMLISQKSKLIANFSRNSKAKFGNLEPYTVKLIIVFLLFGIRKTKKKHWFWQLTE